MHTLLIYVPNSEKDLYNYAVNLTNLSSIPTEIVDQTDPRVQRYLNLPYKYPSFILLTNDFVRTVKIGRLTDIEFRVWLDNLLS